MKRLTALLLALLLMISGALAEDGENLLSYAISMGAALDALAEDEEYLRQFILNTDDPERIRQFAEGKRASPSRIVAVDMSGIMDYIAPRFEELPEAAQRDLRNRMPMALVSALNGQQGTSALLLSMYIRVANMFAAPGVTGQGVWILYYEDASPVAVAWYAENDAILMEACPMSAVELMLGDVPLVVKDVELDDVSLVTQKEVQAAPALDAAALSLADELQVLARSELYVTNLSDQEQVVEACQAFAAPEGAEPVVCVWMKTSESPAPMLYAEIGRMGVETLAAASSLRASVIYADEATAEMGMYILLYERGAPVIVEYAAREGVYWLAASFYPVEELMICRDAEEVQAWAADLGLMVTEQIIEDSSVAE